MPEKNPYIRVGNDMWDKYKLPTHIYYFENNRWMDEASCKGLTEHFFVEQQGKNIPTWVKNMCETCPVRWDCLLYALDNHIKFGVFGGFSPKERWTTYKQNKLRKLANENLMLRSRSNDGSSSSPDN